MLTYIIIDVDECCLTSSMPQRRFTLHEVLSIMLILNKIRFLGVLLMAMLVLTYSGTYHLPYSTNKDRHSPACMT